LPRQRQIIGRRGLRLFDEAVQSDQHPVVETKLIGNDFAQFCILILKLL
jgi:hypothetical protein